MPNVRFFQESLGVGFLGFSPVSDPTETGRFFARVHRTVLFFRQLDDRQALELTKVI